MAPAVVARPRSSSSGSAPSHGRCGNATLTSKARSSRTVRSFRGASRGTVGVETSFPSSILDSSARADEEENQQDFPWARRTGRQGPRPVSLLSAEKGVWLAAGSSLALITPLGEKACL